MGFIEKQTDPTTPMHWKGNMQADYFYPAGVAGDKFFQHLKQNDSFLATKCIKCNKAVCKSCHFKIIGVCKKCIPPEIAGKWDGSKKDWEEELGVEWVD